MNRLFIAIFFCWFINPQLCVANSTCVRAISELITELFGGDALNALIELEQKVQATQQVLWTQGQQYSEVGNRLTTLRLVAEQLAEKANQLSSGGANSGAHNSRGYERRFIDRVGILLQERGL